ASKPGQDARGYRVGLDPSDLGRERGGLDLAIRPDRVQVRERQARQTNDVVAVVAIDPAAEHRHGGDVGGVHAVPEALSEGAAHDGIMHSAALGVSVNDAVENYAQIAILRVVDILPCMRLPPM